MPSPPHEVLIVALREQRERLRALVVKLTGGSLSRGLQPVDAAVRFVKTAEVIPTAPTVSAPRTRRSRTATPRATTSRKSVRAIKA